MPGDHTLERPERQPASPAGRACGRCDLGEVRGRARTGARRETAAAPVRRSRTPRGAPSARPPRLRPRRPRRRTGRRAARPRSPAGGRAAGSGARSPNWPRPELSAPKRVRARQSSGSKRSISGLSACASSPRERSRSTSSIPHRIATRWPRCASSSSVATSGYSRPGTASTYARTTAIGQPSRPELPCDDVHMRNHCPVPAGRRHRWYHRATCLQLLIVLSRRPTSAGRGVTRSGRATRRRGPSPPCRPRHGESSKLVPKPGASGGPQWIECS